MIIIASSNGSVGIGEAMQILKNGGSAMDAVEAGIRLVEANPDDHTVGYNSWPNIIGELELDASIMDGKTLNSGAVAAMKGFPYALSVARQMMERKLPHVLLAGNGAERFAREIKAEHWDEMLTDEVKAVWEKRLSQSRSDGKTVTFDDDSPLQEWVKLATDPERVTSTEIFVQALAPVDGLGSIPDVSEIHPSSGQGIMPTTAMGHVHVQAWVRWRFVPVRRILLFSI